MLTMNARRFQRIHPLRGMGDCVLNASKGFDMGVIDLAVVGSDRTSRVLDAGSGREDDSSDVCCSDENTTVSLCEKRVDDNNLHTHHLCHTARQARIC